MVLSVLNIFSEPCPAYWHMGRNDLKKILSTVLVYLEVSLEALSLPTLEIGEPIFILRTRDSLKKSRLQRRDLVNNRWSICVTGGEK